MSVDQIETPSQARRAERAERASQATLIEQARAVAEVKAQILVAQQCPRSVPAAVDAMREACQVRALADRAFFRYRRGGQPVTGPSVHLARELARCWGNVQYGISELRRDDVAGESEMLAFAWDLQTNTRPTRSIIVPHARDAGGKRSSLTELRDIVENNTNQASRAVRETIYNILPVWYVDEAKGICLATVAQDTTGRPLAMRVADALGVWEQAGVSREQLEAKLGRLSGEWEPLDLAQLRVIWTSLQRGETTLAEEFPKAEAEGPRRRVTAEEITGRPAGQEAPAAEGRGDGTAGEAPAVETQPGPAASGEGGEQPAADTADGPPPSPPARDPGLVSQGRLRLLHAGFGRLGLKGEPHREERLAWVSRIVGHDVDSTSDLTRAEGERVVDVLGRVEDVPGLRRLLGEGTLTEDRGDPS